MASVIWQTAIHSWRTTRRVLHDKISAPDLDDDRRRRPDALGLARLRPAARRRRPARAYCPTTPRNWPPEYQKQMVYYRTAEAPGTIIISTAERHLYLIQGNGRALRYGIGVGRDGFQWQGLLNISRKAEWPDWTPPPEMIARQPYLPRFMAGGPGNPLGARAMYLGTTVYRIHGTNRPDTIGTASLVRLLPAGQCRRRRSLRSRPGRHQGYRAAEAGALTATLLHTRISRPTHFLPDY